MSWHHCGRAGTDERSPQPTDSEVRGQELENELADRCEELRAVQRKLVVARTASLDSQQSLPAAAAAASPSLVKRWLQAPRRYLPLRGLTESVAAV